jgi:hypothetical protein
VPGGLADRLWHQIGAAVWNEVKVGNSRQRSVWRAECGLIRRKECGRRDSARWWYGALVCGNRKPRPWIAFAGRPSGGETRKTPGTRGEEPHSRVRMSTPIEVFPAPGEWRLTVRDDAATPVRPDKPLARISHKVLAKSRSSWHN